MVIVDRIFYFLVFVNLYFKNTHRLWNPPLVTTLFCGAPSSHLRLPTNRKVCHWIFFGRHSIKLAPQTIFLGMHSTFPRPKTISPRAETFSPEAKKDLHEAKRIFPDLKANRRKLQKNRDCLAGISNRIRDQSAPVIFTLESHLSRSARQPHRSPSTPCAFASRKRRLRRLNLGSARASGS